MTTEKEKDPTLDVLSNLARAEVANMPTSKSPSKQVECEYCGGVDNSNWHCASPKGKIKEELEERQDY